MKNIIFIGMPGSGKSTLGVVLAKKLGYSFIDSDLVIQEKYGTTLERIIEKYGDDGFIKIENDVNCTIKAEHQQAKGGTVHDRIGDRRHGLHRQPHVRGAA